MKLDDLENIFTFLEKKDFAECTVEKGDLKVTIKRESAFVNNTPVSATAYQIPMPVASNNMPSAAAASVAPDKKYTEIKSPMVGTFYRKSKPSSPPFVQEGDQIQKGQTICVIEAMKLFNEIESDFQGKIVKILVDDASPVQYDQPLFWIEP